VNAIAYYYDGAALAAGAVKILSTRMQLKYDPLNIDGQAHRKHHSLYQCA